MAEVLGEPQSLSRKDEGQRSDRFAMLESLPERLNRDTSIRMWIEGF